MNTDLTVAGGTSDTQAPVLTGVSIEKASVDTATNATTNVITTQFTDDFSGMGLSKVQIISPTGAQTNTADLVLDTNAGPNAYSGTTQIEQYSETGTWKLRITGKDNSGNYVIYDTAELTAMGQPTGFTVTGNGDTTPPVVTNLNFDVANPVISEVPFGGGVLTLNAQFSDNLSGFQVAVMKFTSPTGAQTSTNTFYLDGSVWRTNIYLPVYAASGTWYPSLDLYDNAGNVAHLDTAALTSLGLNKTFSVAKNITSTVAAGGSVTSDEENNGATPTDPVEVSVTSPVAGSISIVAIDSDQITDQTNGYFFFGRQFSINAPVATIASPLTLSFRIDASKIPSGQSASTLQVTKNGEVLPACVDGTTANPDACVFERNTLGDGDIEVKIHSTTASVWGSGFPVTTGFTFRGFLSPVKNTPKVNKVDAEDSIPIKFDLGANYGLNIMAAGYPQSQKINCTTFAPIGNATATKAVQGNGLKYKDGPGIYRYEWRTLESWEDTCRQFVLKLTDGSTHIAYFKFKD